MSSLEVIEIMNIMIEQTKITKLKIRTEKINIFKSSISN